MISEQKIQSKIINHLKNDGWIALKTIKLSASGYPDIIALRNKITLFVEVKSEKGILSELQKHRINELSLQGFKVIIANSIENFKLHYENIIE